MLLVCWWTDSTGSTRRRWSYPTTPTSPARCGTCGTASTSMSSNSCSSSKGRCSHAVESDRIAMSRVIRTLKLSIAGSSTKLPHSSNRASVCSPRSTLTSDPQISRVRAFRVRSPFMMSSAAPTGDGKAKGRRATHPPLGQPYPGLPTLVFRPGSLTKRDPAALTANPNDLSCDNCRPNPSGHPGVQPVPMEALDRRGWRLLGREARGPHLREPG